MGYRRYTDAPLQLALKEEETLFATVDGRGHRPVQHAVWACICTTVYAKQAGIASVHAAGLGMPAFRFARRGG